MRRRLSEDHEAVRQTARAFFEREARPRLHEWEQAGRVDPEFYERAGEIGFFGFQVPEAFGGSNLGSYSFNAMVSEAAASVNFVPSGFRVHADIVIPYFLRLGSEEQKQRWLPELVYGRSIGAIAMSEPDTGSDLAGIRTSAELTGNAYILTGTKTFITSGLNAGLVIVVARTEKLEDRRAGLTLLVVEDGMRGFTRGPAMRKLGLPYSDTCEVYFEDVEVPESNRLGEPGKGFEYLRANLPQERLSISVGAIAMAMAALESTLEYVKARRMFGTTLASFQNTKFVLAEVATEIEAAQHLLDSAIENFDQGELSAHDAAKVKLFCTEVQNRTVDRLLQLHGGYGYIWDTPIAKMYADARVTRIFGGTSEVMKVIIAQSLGL